MEKHKKLHGVRMDAPERERKREARSAHKLSEFAQKSFGIKAKFFNQKRFKEKAIMRKTINMHQEGSKKQSSDEKVTDGKYFSSHKFYIQMFIPFFNRCCASLFNGPRGNIQGKSFI